MTHEPPALRASDADRERAVAQLREHAAEGRLTLEELAARTSAAYDARTQDELEALARDLPQAPGRAAPRRRPTRFLLSLFASTSREGRIRVRRRVVCATLFGNVDLDLRRATLEGDVITIVAVCLLRRDRRLRAGGRRGRRARPRVLRPQARARR